MIHQMSEVRDKKGKNNTLKYLVEVDEENGFGSLGMASSSSVANHFKDDLPISSYLDSLSINDLDEQYSELQRRASWNYEETSNCSNLPGKMSWQSGLIKLLDLDKKPQSEMGNFIAKNGEKMSELYCALNCPCPCYIGSKDAKKLIPFYEDTIRDRLRTEYYKSQK